MKRKIDFLIVALFAVVLFASCERVAPNYAGVLMENYGKQGKEDFKIVAGKVSTWELKIIFWSHVYMILSKKKVANIKQTV